MLLERITLQNFRAFRGRHDLELAPESPSRPIILVTGLNGAGKTTILEALYFVLYGKRTPSPRRSGQAYERYLEECRHQATDVAEDAGVELRFSQVVEGEPVTYLLQRFWATTKNSIRERFEVVVNGIEDPVLRDDWGQYIEELLPSRLAPLFFFDGEKIESLADLDATAQVLSVAIHSLLGLDLVDQLHNDLEMLERKRAADRADPELARELELLDQTKESALQTEKQAYEDRASLNSQLDRARVVLRRKEREFESQGGLAFDQRTKLEASLESAEQAVADCRKRLQGLAGDYAPLLLVPELLERVSDQVASERVAHESRLLAELLESRDEVLLQKLGAAPDSHDWIEDIEAWLGQDRQERRHAGSREEILRLSSVGASQLDHLVANDLPKTTKLIRQQLKRHRGSQRDLEDARKRLAGIPNEGSLRHIRVERDAARQEVAQLESLLAIRVDALEAATRALAGTQRKLQAAHQRNVKARTERSTTLRLVEHSAKVRATLSVFREKVLHRHIERIQELVLEGLHGLLRKNRLVTGLEISPEDFSVRLYGPEGRTLPPELLSAGERQLLAIALLWGLARAARRPMPTLIDTPLGRLDSAHRRHLVDRYFPFASHQVILLSTDEEISGPLLDRLWPKIGRSYLLEHDDATGVSSVLPVVVEKTVRVS